MGANVFFQVIAFSNEADAKRHMEARQNGCPELAPLNQACAQCTGPGQCRPGSTDWNSKLEFIGLGPRASQTAQASFLEIVPECFEAGSMSHSTSRGTASWPKLLPPPFVHLANEKDCVNEWTSRLVPWLGDPARCPPGW